MNRLIFPLLGLAVLLVAGCGSSDSNKPPTQDEVTQFKGHPSSPAVQNALRSHFGGGPPAAPQAGPPKN